MNVESTLKTYQMTGSSAPKTFEKRTPQHFSGIANSLSNHIQSETMYGKDETSRASERKPLLVDNSNINRRYNDVEKNQTSACSRTPSARSSSHVHPAVAAVAAIPRHSVTDTTPASMASNSPPSTTARPSDFVPIAATMRDNGGDGEPTPTPSDVVLEFDSPLQTENGLGGDGNPDIDVEEDGNKATPDDARTASPSVETAPNNGTARPAPNDPPSWMSRTMAALRNIAPVARHITMTGAAGTLLYSIADPDGPVAQEAAATSVASTCLTYGFNVISNDTRFDDLETRFDDLETRLDDLETRLDGLEEGMEEVKKTGEEVLTKIDKLLGMAEGSYKK